MVSGVERQPQARETSRVPRSRPAQSASSSTRTNTSDGKSRRFFHQQWLVTRRLRRERPAALILQVAGVDQLLDHPLSLIFAIRLRILLSVVRIIHGPFETQRPAGTAGQRDEHQQKCGNTHEPGPQPVGDRIASTLVSLNRSIRILGGSTRCFLHWAGKIGHDKSGF